MSVVVAWAMLPTSLPSLFCGKRRVAFGSKSRFLPSREPIPVSTSRHFISRSPRYRARLRASQTPAAVTQRQTAESILLRVNNLRCGGCAIRAERTARAAGGDALRYVSVNALTKTAVLELCDRSALPTVLAALESKGYPSQLCSEKEFSADMLDNCNFTDNNGAAVSPSAVIRDGVRLALLLCLALALQCTHCAPKSTTFLGRGILSIFGDHLRAMPSWLPATFLPVALLTVSSLREVIVDGTSSLLWQRNPNMNTLVTLGSGAGFLSALLDATDPSLPAGERSGFIEPLALLVIVSVGKFIERCLRKRAGDELRALAQLQPPIAIIASSGQRVPVFDVVADDILLVAPGERVPVDAELVSASGFVDASVVTGESTPRWVVAGDELLAGSVVLPPNEGGEASLLKLRTLRPAAESHLMQVASLRIGSSIPERRRSVDILAGAFCWITLAAAFLTWLGWKVLARNAAATMPLHFAASVLAAACPCALALAAPLALSIAAARAATMGVRVQNADALESLARADAIVLDKTGTLTDGAAYVNAYVSPSETLGEHDVLRIAAFAERGSTHPLAQMITSAANATPNSTRASSLELGAPEATHVTMAGGGESKGGGVSRGKVSVGEPRWLEQRHPEARVSETLQKIFRAGAEGRRRVENTLVGLEATTLGVVHDSCCIGGLRVSQRLQPGAVDALIELRKVSSTRALDLWLMSGDDTAAVRAAASSLGFASDRWRARQSSQDKLLLLKDLQRQGKVVAAVGDGVNDAVLLGAADVSLSLRGATALAQQRADVLLTGGIAALPRAMSLARRTARTIRWSVCWALLYNALLLPVAAGLLYVTPLRLRLSPARAAAAMSTSSISVMLISLSLLFRLRHGSVQKSVL